MLIDTDVTKSMLKAERSTMLRHKDPWSPQVD